MFEITPVDPFYIDAIAQVREARESAAVWAKAMAPPHSYTSAEVAARMPRNRVTSL